MASQGDCIGSNGRFRAAHATELRVPQARKACRLDAGAVTGDGLADEAR